MHHLKEEGERERFIVVKHCNVFGGGTQMNIYYTVI